MLIIFLFLTAFYWSNKPVYAAVTFEQQINIIDQEYYTISTTDSPTDNSLGIIKWTSANYPDSTVYFEAMIRSGFATYTATATLYDITEDPDAAVSGATVSTTAGYTRVRSSAITLTDGHEYTARLKVSCTGCAAYFKAARLIVVQSDSTKIIDTENQVEIGNAEGKSDTSYSSIEGKKLYRYDSSVFSPTPTAYFESSFRASSPMLEQQIEIVDQEYYVKSSTDGPTDNSLGIIKWVAGNYTGATVYFEAVMKSGFATYNVSATLYDVTADPDTAVSGSTTPTTTNGTYTRLRATSAITLTDGREYTVRIKSSNGSEAYIKSARLIIVQSNSTKITDTEQQVDIGNGEGRSANSYDVLDRKKLYYYDSSGFNPTPTAYFESTFRASSPKLDQQINIIDQIYSSSSATDNPTDNSLGLIRWTSGSYTSATVYFEAIIKTASGTSTATATLYNSSGVAVSGAAVSTSSANYTRLRSSAITLTDGTDYTVRIKNSTGAQNTFILSARLIILQSDSTRIDDTETQIEVGNSVTDITNTTYSTLTDPKIYLYDTNKFSGTESIYFEATLHSDNASDTVFAQLLRCNSASDCSGGTAVTGSEISTNSTTYARVRSSDIFSNMTDDANYAVQIKTSAGTGDIANAKIINVQDGGGTGLTDVEVIHEYINTLNTQATSTYTNKTSNNLYDPQNFGVWPSVYFEASMKTSSGTGYARLENTGLGVSTAAISNAELTTTLTTYNRVRTASDLVLNLLPQAVQDMDIEMKNSATNTTSVSSSWLVIQFSSIPTNGPTGAVELYNDTDGTSVSGSEVTSTSASFTRIKSNSFSLTTGKNYSVRIKSAFQANAKLTLNQSNAGGVTATEIIHQNITVLTTEATSTYTNKNYFNLFDPQNFGVWPTVYYEATMKTSAGTGYTQLEDAIANFNTISISSEITTTSTSYTRVRGTDNLMYQLKPQASQNIDVEVKNSATNTTSVTASWLIIQLANIPTTASTGAIQLYNDTDSTSVSGSEVTSTNSGFTRVRSGSVSLTTNKNYSVQLKSAFQANAKLILVQSDTDGIATTELLHQQVNAVFTRANSGYADQDINNQYDPTNFAGGTFNYFYEATLKASAGTAYAILENDTNSDQINSPTTSEVTVISTSYTRIRSGSLGANTDWPTTAKNMDTQIRNSASNTTYASNTWLVIQTSNMSPPDAPSSLAQYKSDGTTSISTGSYTNETSVVLKMSMNHTNNPDTLTPEVEIRAVGTSFTDSVTDTGSGVAFSGSPVTGTVTVTGLTDGQSYHWQSRVCDSSSRCSDWGSYGANLESEADFTVDTTNPTTPGTPSTTTPTSDTTPTWTWTASSDSGSGLAATPYTVEWCDNSGFTGCEVFASTSSTNSFTHSTALADGTWYFRVRATDVAGNVSSYSSNGSAVIDTTAPLTPGTPSTTTPTADSTPVWTWTASSDSGSGLASTPYTIEWCTDSGFSGCGSNTDTSTTNSYTHSTELANGTWYVRVKAKDTVDNESGYSSNGTAVIDTTGPTTPGTPTSTSLTTDTTPEWTWTASIDSGVGLATTPYTVEWCTDSGFSGCAANTDTTSTNSFTHTTALAAGTWYFRVKAEDTLGNESSYSSNGTFTIASSSTGDSTKPSKPGKPSTSTPTSDNTPKWKWNESTDNVALDDDEPYYVTWCKNSRFNNCSGNVDTADDNEYTHGDSLSDGTWYFKVRAKDSSGNYSNYSSSGKVVIDTTAPIITITGTTVTETSIKVTWKTNEKSQTIIEWGTSNSYGRSYTNSSLVKDHSYNITGLSKGTLYYLKITSKDSLSNTGKVELQRQTLGTLEATLITDINVVINSPTSATINWKTNHAATSEIDYGLTTNFTDQTISTDKVIVHSMTLVGLTSDTTYFYEIISVGNTTAVNAFRTFDTPGEEIIEEIIEETTDSKEASESTSVINEIVDTITDTIEDVVETITDTVKDIVDKITEIIRTEEFNKPVDTVFAVGIKKLIRDLPIPKVIKDIAEKAIDVIKSPQTQKIITFVAVVGNIASALTVLPNIREIISTLNQIKHVNILGLLFGLFRRKKNPWGIVYDSQTKQPLDPVILTLTDPSGKIYQTISDIYGRYEFIVDPGEYTLSAIKTNYTFPSKILMGKKDDGIYENLYFGEKLNIQQDQKIQVHIPMDRENVDWNQLEKQRMGIVNRNVRLYKAVDYLFNATLILNILSLSLSYSLEKIVIFSLFIFLYTYHNYIKSHKPWGIVTNLENQPLGGIVLRLVHVKFPKISGAIAVTKDNGRYNFLVRKGTYQIVAHKKNPDGTTQEINRSKVMDVKKEQGSLGPDFRVDAKTKVNSVTK